MSDNCNLFPELNETFDCGYNSNSDCFCPDYKNVVCINGKDGKDGKNGKDGTTFIPSISPDGTISWSNTDGKSNPTPVNVKGQKGDTGAKGDKGDKGDKGVLSEMDLARIQDAINQKNISIDLVEIEQ